MCCNVFCCSIDKIFCSLIVSSCINSWQSWPFFKVCVRYPFDHIFDTLAACRVCFQNSNFLSVWVLMCILMIVPLQDNLAPTFRLAIAKPIWPVWAEDRGATQSSPPCTLWDWRQQRSCQSSIWWPSNRQGNIFSLMCGTCTCSVHTWHCFPLCWFNLNIFLYGTRTQNDFRLFL